MCRAHWLERKKSRNGAGRERCFGKKSQSRMDRPFGEWEGFLPMVEMTHAWVEVPSRDIVDWAQSFFAPRLAICTECHLVHSKKFLRNPRPAGTWAGCTPRCLHKPLPPACRS